MLHELACAISGGDERIAGVFVDELNAAGGGHLDYRSKSGIVSIPKNAVFRNGLSLQRIEHLRTAYAAMSGIHQRANRAFAAIGHRHHHVFGIRKHPQQTISNSRACLLCRHTSFE